MSENLLALPSTVCTSGLSPRARLLLLDFTHLAVDNYLFPSQAAFAKDYGCSKTTIGRAIKELIRAGLLVDIGERDMKRRKKYGLNPAIQNPIEKTGLLRSARNDDLPIPDITTEEEYLESLPVNLQIDYLFGKYGPDWFEQYRNQFDDMAHLRRKIVFYLVDAGRFRKIYKADVKSWVESCLKPKDEGEYRPAPLPPGIKPLTYQSPY